MWSQKFWLAVLDRAVKTFAETLAGMLAINALTPMQTNWVDSLAVAGMATLIAILLNIATAGATNGEPSLTTEKLR